MHLPPPPNSRDLLPPLLACLPTSFVTPRPPPTLLPMLSPLLRQRVNFLSDTAGNDGWLPLLSWDTQRGAKLPAAVKRMDLEPHPVSGELELEEVPSAKYRRLDEETLQARLDVEQFDLLPTWVWCEQDEHGGTEPGWKLSELCVLEDKQSDSEWSDSPSEASDSAISGTASAPQPSLTPGDAKEQDIDDDDYWAAYDRTPSGTPGHELTAARPSSNLQPASSSKAQAESDYYARYGEEVQPAMDSHDPDEATAGAGHSTLTGDSLTSQLARLESSEPPRFESPLIPSYARNKPQDSALGTLDPSARTSYLDGLSMPRPISPASSHSSVDKLEEKAAAMSLPNDLAQNSIRQHISTDIKSLFRLAKSVGMQRQEFERIVKTELECLGFMEADE